MKVSFILKRKMIKDLLGNSIERIGNAIRDNVYYDDLEGLQHATLMIKVYVLFRFSKKFL